MLSLGVSGAESAIPYRFEAQLRKAIQTDATVKLASLRIAGHVALATWSNGTVLAIASKASQDKVTAGEVFRSRDRESRGSGRGGAGHADSGCHPRQRLFRSLPRCRRRQIRKQPRRATGSHG